MHVELGIDRAQVGTHGVLGDDQAIGNPIGTAPLSEKPQNLKLTLGQSVACIGGALRDIALRGAIMHRDGILARADMADTARVVNDAPVPEVVFLAAAA